MTDPGGEMTFEELIAVAEIATPIVTGEYFLGGSRWLGDADTHSDFDVYYATTTTPTDGAAGAEVTEPSDRAGDQGPARLPGAEEDIPCDLAGNGVVDDETPYGRENVVSIETIVRGHVRVQLIGVQCLPCMRITHQLALQIGSGKAERKAGVVWPLLERIAWARHGDACVCTDIASGEAGAI